MPGAIAALMIGGLLSSSTTAEAVPYDLDYNIVLELASGDDVAMTVKLHFTFTDLAHFVGTYVHGPSNAYEGSEFQLGREQIDLTLRSQDARVTTENVFYPEVFIATGPQGVSISFVTFWFNVTGTSGPGVEFNALNASFDSSFIRRDEQGRLLPFAFDHEDARWSTTVGRHSYVEGAPEGYQLRIVEGFATPRSVPEPSTLLLIGLGSALSLRRRRLHSGGRAGEPFNRASLKDTSS